MKDVRKQIVEMLKTAGEKFVSGESIAETLGISRAAVWKHVQKLRESGYEILSRERYGYKLKDAPDLLLPSEVQIDLETQIIGKEMYYEPSVESTNLVAKKLAYYGAPEGTIVVAEEQTGGKGRMSREFFSPRVKGIWFSIVLRPTFLPKDAPKCTLLAAVAVARAMRRFDLQPEIKWPNDIFHDGRKLVGILTEMTGEIAKITYLVVGIGINVNISRNEFPENLRGVATSLSEMNGGKDIPRVKFFRAVLEEFDKLYCEVTESGFAGILSLWREYNITLGKKIRVSSVDGEVFTGKALDLNADGALIVETAQGLRELYAGDVSIR